jgi:hypothetical protein
MPTHKDYDFVVYLVRMTRENRIKWEPTALEMQFAASFKGRYTVLIDKAQTPKAEPRYWLTMKDESGRELLNLKGADLTDLGELYEIIERKSLNVDAAIDEIMGGPDEDVPS